MMVGFFFIISLGILAGAITVSYRAFTTAVAYKRERLEKSCDAVISLLALLISGSLLVISWVFDKIRAPGYGKWLFLAMFWFFVVLIFTLFMRFNFTWGIAADDFHVGDGQNTVVLAWLSTIMVGVTFGLGCLAIPVLLIAWNTPTPPPSPTQIIQVECKVDAPKPTPTPTTGGQKTKSGQNQKATKKKKGHR